MRISNDKIEEVRSSNDIVDVVAAHVHLKKRGKNFVGLCPFHQEKTPSFTVSAEKQLYHCFGCGKGGNVFTFVMEMEKVSFVEAVRTLAARVGLALPEGAQDDTTQSEVENLYNACRFAGRFFHENLIKSDEGKAVLEYFHERGFTDDTIRIFGLGHSLNSWDSLLQRAVQDGLRTEFLLKAGLIRTRDDGAMYDYFRGRAMFPIFSTAGRVVGFGARKLRDDDPLGKYINSPETSIYNKSRILFGLFQSKEAIRAENYAVLVEGYADLISLFQAGIQNVVASSGTALTEEQIQLIGRYTKNLTLVYDADSAGSNAALRGIDLALEHDLDVKVVELPEGEDPDSFVRKNGGNEFRKLLGEALSFIDFKANQFLKSGMFNTPEGQAQAVRSIVQSIARMRDELKRNFYLRHVAEKYGIYESILYRELEQWTADRRPVRKEIPQSRRVPLYDVPVADVTPERRHEIPAGERDILKLMLENRPELIGFIFSHVSIADLNDERVRKAAQMILDRLDTFGSVELTSLVHEIDDPELKGIVTDLALSRYELSKGWKEMDVEIDDADPWEVARGALLALKRQSLYKQIEENRRRLKEISQQGGEVLPFLQRHQELLKQMKELESSEFLKAS